MINFYITHLHAARKATFLSILFVSIVSVTRAQNPLAEAQGFNVFTMEDFTIRSGDVEGAIAVGGDFFIQGTTNRTSMNATGKPAFVTLGGLKYALVVNGALHGTNGATFTIDGKSGLPDDHYVRIGNLNGSSTEANNAGINIGAPASNVSTRYMRINQTVQNNSTVHNSTALVDFGTAFSALRNESSRLKNLVNNISVVNSGGQANITLSSNPVHVWNVTGTTLGSFSQINLSGVLPDATHPLVINVDATGTFNWNNIRFFMGSESDNQMEINRAPYIVWNFYNNTTTLNIQHSNLVLGSILAADAIVTNNGNGNITGQIIARAFVKPNAGEVHIAPFSAAIGGSTLAVRKINLNPQYSNNQVAVNWTTESEINSAYFEVERSYDGNVFEQAGKINSQAVNGSNGAYSITDKSFRYGVPVLYYRIKAVDINGIISYSFVAAVRISSTNITASSWPNPFVNSITLNYTSPAAAEIEVQINSLEGSKIRSQQFSVIKGQNILPVTGLVQLQPGSYLIIINNLFTGSRTALKVLMIPVQDQLNSSHLRKGMAAEFMRFTGGS